jgi:hypothetical protein
VLVSSMISLEKVGGRARPGRWRFLGGGDEIIVNGAKDRFCHDQSWESGSKINVSPPRPDGCGPRRYRIETLPEA